MPITKPASARGETRLRRSATDPFRPGYFRDSHVPICPSRPLGTRLAGRPPIAQQCLPLQFDAPVARLLHRPPWPLPAGPEVESDASAGTARWCVAVDGDRAPATQLYWSRPGADRPRDMSRAPCQGAQLMPVPAQIDVFVRSQPPAPSDRYPATATVVAVVDDADSRFRAPDVAGRLAPGRRSGGP